MVVGVKEAENCSVNHVCIPWQCRSRNIALFELKNKSLTNLFYLWLWELTATGPISPTHSFWGELYALPKRKVLSLVLKADLVSASSTQVGNWELKAQTSAFLILNFLVGNEIQCMRMRNVCSCVFVCTTVCRTLWNTVRLFWFSCKTLEKSVLQSTILFVLCKNRIVLKMPKKKKKSVRCTFNNLDGLSCQCADPSISIPTTVVVIQMIWQVHPLSWQSESITHSLWFTYGPIYKNSSRCRCKQYLALTFLPLSLLLKPKCKTCTCKKDTQAAQQMAKK